MVISAGRFLEMRRTAGRFKPQLSGTSRGFAFLCGRGIRLQPGARGRRWTKGYLTVTHRSPFMRYTAAWDRQAAPRPWRGGCRRPRYRRERFMSSRLTRIASVTGIAGLALTALAATALAAGAAGAGDSAPTMTPIKHVIVIIGENHTFDNVFATYQPPAGQPIWNLRSE